MSAIDILTEIKRLPISDQLMVVEKTLHTMRVEEIRSRMREAAQRLKHDYETDKELTAFTALDGEDFYEYEAN
jgi:hypothetical protein